MSISDEMMWRYWELLTDVSMHDIGKMREDVGAGRAHTMSLKKDLARRIVTDFHSAAEASKAEEDWAKQFQKDELPENLDVVTLPLSEVASNDGNGVRVDRLLVRSGLAESNSEANRKIKEKAVRVDGEVSTALTLQLKPGSELTLRLGRKIKKILIAA